MSLFKLTLVKGISLWTTCPLFYVSNFTWWLSITNVFSRMLFIRSLLQRTPVWKTLKLNESLKPQSLHKHRIPPVPSQNRSLTRGRLLRMRKWRLTLPALRAVRPRRMLFLVMIILVNTVMWWAICICVEFFFIVKSVLSVKKSDITFCDYLDIQDFQCK